MDLESEIVSLRAQLKALNASFLRQTMHQNLRRDNDIEAQLNRILGVRQEIAGLSEAVLRLEDSHNVEPDIRQPQTVKAFQGYGGPFAANVISAAIGSQTDVKFRHGFVYAGAEAEYYWPGSGDTFQQSGISTGWLLHYLEIKVDPEYGYFTATYKPTLKSIDAALFYDATQHLNTNDACHIVLAATFGETDIMECVQFHHGDIYVPVIRTHDDSSGYDKYVCSWEITVPGTVAAPGVAPTEDNGDTSPVNITD